MKPDAAAQKIRAWLSQEGVPFEERPNPNDRFRFIAQVRGVIPVEVFQPSSSGDRITIICAFDLDVGATRTINAMDPQKRQSLIWKIHLGLLQMEPEFSIPLPLNRVVVAATIWHDALTKDEFLRRMRSVHRSSLWLVRRVHQAIGEEPPGFQASEAGIIN